jgi:transcription elongation factor Elf1
MEVPIDMYPEGVRDQLEDAIKTSVDEYVQKEIREKNVECPECGSMEFSAEVEKKGGGEFDEKAVCDSCEERVDIEVEVGDLRSGF